MKVVFFGGCYPMYFKTLYGNISDLSSRSFQEQYRIIVSDYFGSFFMYYKWTKYIGYDSLLIISNCEPLQKKWAEENDFTLTNEDNWLEEIALEQVKKYRPDVFFMGSYFNLFGEFIGEIKKVCHNVFAWIACPIPSNANYSQFDLILTSVEHYKTKFIKEGIPSEVLSAGFDSTLLEKVKVYDDPIPLSFIGGFSSAHSNRIKTIRQLVFKTEIQIWGYGGANLLYPEKTFSFRKKAMNKQIKSRIRTEVWGIEMYELLHNSKIVFNSHINVASGISGNMRVYEATGMGAMLLTDGDPNSNIYEDGRDVVYYKDIPDAIEKANYYLLNEEERCSIAKSGQKKTIQYNSYEVITKKLLLMFKSYIK